MDHSTGFSDRWFSHKNKEIHGLVENGQFVNGFLISFKIRVFSSEHSVFNWI